MDQDQHQSNSCHTDTPAGQLSCKLSSGAFRKRKETVLSRLKQKLLEKKELATGYAYRFPGTDEMLDELHAFIKTERSCCSFFTFRLSVSGASNDTWLELTGTGDVKNFITRELGF